MPGSSDYLTHVEAFCRGVRVLTRDLAKHAERDPDAIRATKRIFAAIDIAPLCVVDIVGGYLAQYGKQIYAKDEVFFMDNDYDQELRASTDDEKEGMVRKLMPKVKEYVRTLTREEKDAYFETVAGLLDSYLDYRETAGR